MFKLLIVEDEYMIRTNLACRYPWGEMGFRVCGAAESGEKGLQLFKEQNPDVVLFDYRMDGMNGLDMLEEMRKCNHSFYAVLLTGYSEFSIAKRAIELQVRAYLTKPMRQDEVKQIFTTLYSELAQKAGIKDDYHYDPVLMPAINYIREYYSVEISLEELARMCAVSVPWFCKLFKQNFSITAKEYITLLRVNQAKRLIQTTDLKMYEIADRVGYDDFRYFSRVFKALEGKAPSEYKSETQGRSGEPMV